MKITIYTINECKFSASEKAYLQGKNLPFEEKNLESNRDFLTEMLNISNNFAGTPVTRIEKDDGQVIILKGFTQEEFDKALSGVPTGQSSVQPPLQNLSTAPAAVQTQTQAMSQPMSPTPDHPVQPAVMPVQPVAQPQPVAAAPIAPQAMPPVQPVMPQPTMPQAMNQPVQPTAMPVEPVQPVAQPQPVAVAPQAMPPVQPAMPPSQPPMQSQSAIDEILKQIQTQPAADPMSIANPAQAQQPPQMPTPEPVAVQVQAPPQAQDPLSSIMQNLQSQSDATQQAPQTVTQ